MPPTIATIPLVYEVQSLDTNDTLLGTIDNFYFPGGLEIKMEVDNTTRFHILSAIKKPSIGDTIRMYGTFKNSHYRTTMYVDNKLTITADHTTSGKFHMEHVIRRGELNP